MKKILTIAFCLLAALSFSQNYIQNRAPLRAKPYLELPLGSIQPEGWLKEQLVRMAKGSTGNLDILYPQVMGKRNGWLGGDGDVWERGPYWLDGLLPLAYILKDEALIAKAKPWVEWALTHQRADGYFGPDKDYPNEPGLQRGNSKDWWPKMVMLKILMQYYSATQDKRVVDLFTRYFKYQLRELPKTPLGHWTFWGEQRGGDNLLAVYWLYNITGDTFLLELAELIHKQTYNWTDVMNKGEVFAGTFGLHGVNVGQGLKEPLIYYQQHPEEKYSGAVKKGLATLRNVHGQPQGMFAADEWLHGMNPTQGSELCTAVELMYSLENFIAITGDIQYADHLEKIAFNALPAQVSDDYNTHQYYQQPNQVMVTRQVHNFQEPHEATDIAFGLLTGYPCCTSNMHQGWPKFTQSLWFATPDNGVAALVYAPSRVTVKVGNHVSVTVKEETNYPFDETIRFTVTPEKPVSFPMHLRVPAWCRNASVTINGKTWKKVDTAQILVINREWKANDVVELTLNMHIAQSQWYEKSIAVERGPLVYALKIGEEWKKIDSTDKYGKYYEVYPTTAWNYGLIETPASKLQEDYKVIKKETPLFPWNSVQTPVEIRVKAKKIPSWTLYNEMAGPLPYSTQWQGLKNVPVEEVTLIPYGCTKLRITEFPVVAR